MKLSLKYLLLFWVGSCLFKDAIAQDLSFQETLDYINQRLKENPTQNGYCRTATQNGYFIVYNPRMLNDEFVGYCGGVMASLENVVSVLSQYRKCGNSNDIRCTYYIQVSNCEINFSSANSTCENTERKLTLSPGLIIEFQCNPSLSNNLLNALYHLADLINQNPTYYGIKDYSNDPFSTESSSYETLAQNSQPGKYSVSLTRNEGGTFSVPIEVNGVLKISMILDSGASDVTVSPDVALTLIRTGTITESDFRGSKSYVFADGSIAQSQTFVIRSIKIGEKILHNVEASISSSLDAPLLLGQSVLGRFGSFKVDYNSNLLIFED